MPGPVDKTHQHIRDFIDQRNASRNSWNNMMGIGAATSSSGLELDDWRSVPPPESSQDMIRRQIASAKNAGKGGTVVKPNRSPGTFKELALPKTVRPGDYASNPLARLKGGVASRRTPNMGFQKASSMPPMPSPFTPVNSAIISQRHDMANQVFKLGQARKEAEFLRTGLPTGPMGDMMEMIANPEHVRVGAEFNRAANLAAQSAAFNTAKASNPSEVSALLNSKRVYQSRGLLDSMVRIGGHMTAMGFDAAKSAAPHAWKAAQFTSKAVTGASIGQLGAAGAVVGLGALAASAVGGPEAGIGALAATGVGLTAAGMLGPKAGVVAGVGAAVMMGMSDSSPSEMVSSAGQAIKMAGPQLSRKSYGTTVYQQSTQGLMFGLNSRRTG